MGTVKILNFTNLWNLKTAYEVQAYMSLFMKQILCMVRFSVYTSYNGG